MKDVLIAEEDKNENINVDENCRALQIKEGRQLAITSGHDLIPVTARTYQGVDEAGWLTSCCNKNDPSLCESTERPIIYQGMQGIASHYEGEAERTLNVSCQQRTGSQCCGRGCD